MWPFRNDGRSKVTAVLSKLQDLVALLRERACNRSTGRIDCSTLIIRCSPPGMDKRNTFALPTGSRQPGFHRFR
jgi:hypothetical protein